MRRLSRFLLGFVLALAVLVGAVIGVAYWQGYGYLLEAFADQAKRREAFIPLFERMPSSQDFKTFDNQVVRAGVAAPWQEAEDYNSRQLTAADRAYLMVALADDANGLQQTQIAHNSFTEISEEVNLYISVNAKSSEFSSEVIGKAPFQLVADASNSTGENLNFYWDFGDGVSSTDVRVQHLYEKSGKYALKVKVSNPISSDASTILINVLDADDADFQVVDVPFTITRVFSDHAHYVESDYDLHFLEGNTISDNLCNKLSRKDGVETATNPDENGIKAERLYEVCFRDWYKSEGTITIKQALEVNQEIEEGLLVGTSGEYLAHDILLLKGKRRFVFSHENSIRASVLLMLSYTTPFPENPLLADKILEFYDCIAQAPSFANILDKLEKKEWHVFDAEYTKAIVSLYNNELRLKLDEILAADSTD